MTTPDAAVNTAARTASKPAVARVAWPRRFSLRALFVVTALAAWCSWQWSIAEKRNRVAKELSSNGCFIYRDATVNRVGIERIYLGEVLNGKCGETFKQPAFSAILGIGNWDGLTATTFAWGDPWQDARVTELSRLPGLTTIVIYCARDGSKNERVDALERRLRAKLPRVKIRRFVNPPIPVGFQAYKGLATV